MGRLSSPHPGDEINQGWSGAELAETGVDLPAVVGRVRGELQKGLAQRRGMGLEAGALGEEGGPGEQHLPLDCFAVLLALL